MPNKNKPQRNGFYYYMQDMMPQLKRQGYHFPRGMADIVPVAHPGWKALPQSEKDRYDQRAKEEKAKMRGSVGDSYRMDNTRTLISQRKCPMQETQLAKNEQRQYRRDFLGWREGPSMLHEKLYFIDFSSMCRMEDTEYWIPLEMSLAEYSMKDGITRTLHKFIHPGQIPLGYRYECQNKSETQHLIPIENFKLASDDYLNIWHSLENFLSPNSNKDLPPLYTQEHKLEETKGCILWLLHQSRVGSARGARIRVHFIETMVQDLFNYADTGAPPAEASIHELLNSTQWDYQRDVVCGYHEELDSKVCTMGRVKIYCFAISDSMAPLYDFSLTPTHLPKVDPRDVGEVIEPKPIAPERNLRQQVKPAFRGRGGAKGRGYMPPRDQDEGPVFGGRDVRQKDERESRYVADRDRFDDEFAAAAPPLRQPASSGIAAQMGSLSLSQNTNQNQRSTAQSVLKGTVHKDDPAFRGERGPTRPVMVIGEDVADTTPRESPWAKKQEPKPFDEEFPSLGGAGGSRGRGSMPPREISLGRGQFMWAQPAAVSTGFVGAGRGRGYVGGPPVSQPVPPPPGILR